MENKNQPAFPPSKEMCEMPNGENNIEQYPFGLTKREYFAAMAMQGICASGANDFNTDHVQQIAEIAVKQADALLTALDKTK